MITKYYAEEGDTVEVGAQFLEVDTDAKGGWCVCVCFAYMMDI